MIFLLYVRFLFPYLKLGCYLTSKAVQISCFSFLSLETFSLFSKSLHLFSCQERDTEKQIWSFLPFSPNDERWRVPTPKFTYHLCFFTLDLLWGKGGGRMPGVFFICWRSKKSWSISLSQFLPFHWLLHCRSFVSNREEIARSQCRRPVLFSFGSSPWSLPTSVKLSLRLSFFRKIAPQ